MPYGYLLASRAQRRPPATMYFYSPAGATFAESHGPLMTIIGVSGWGGHQGHTIAAH